MAEHHMLLGSANWSVPDWVGPFYPEDMPAEWRLAYYNTRFSCVWLPYAVWHQATSEDAREWVNDTRNDFRFLLEAGDAETGHDQTLLEVLAPRLGLHGRSDHPDLVWFESGVDLRKLSVTLRQRAADKPVTYVLSRDADMATLDQVNTLLGLLNLGLGGGVG